MGSEAGKGVVIGRVIKECLHDSVDVLLSAILLRGIDRDPATPHIGHTQRQSPLNQRIRHGHQARLGDLGQQLLAVDLLVDFAADARPARLIGAHQVAGAPRGRAQRVGQRFLQSFVLKKHGLQFGRIDLDHLRRGGHAHPLRAERLSSRSPQPNQDASHPRRPRPRRARPRRSGD